jgi:prepilin-type processing-associated H-X9-DG protein
MSRKAILSAILGASSFILLILTGIPAMLFGFVSLREINRSDGRLRGRGFAVAGMVMGAAGSLLFVVGLVALILINIHATASRVMCENNLRLIGLALNLYCDAKGRFPAGTLPQKELPVDKRLSWVVALLPFIEQDPAAQKKKPTAAEALFAKLDRKEAWDAPPNQAAVRERPFWCRCPADNRPREPQQPALINYVGLAGIGADAATLPASDPRAGFLGYDRRITRGDVGGGISNTIAATETAWDIGPWAAGGPATIRGLDPEQRPYIGPGRPFGGLHARGLNVLFVDASVRFVRQDIRPETFEQLATIHEGK